MSAPPSIPDSDDSNVRQTKRRWTRIKPDDETADVLIRLPSGRTEIGIIMNESFGGLGVMLLDGRELEVEQVVEVEYYGAPAQAVIKRIAVNDNHTWMVAIEWAATGKTVEMRNGAVTR